MSVVIDESFFNFAIHILTLCEQNKKWEIAVGKYDQTCGYTAPGIGLVIKLLEHNNIHNIDSLTTYLAQNGITTEEFSDSINETIGNLLDDFKGHCPVTDVVSGIRGLIKQQIETEAVASSMMEVDEEPKIYKVAANGSNLKEGVNVISFVTRMFKCDTFHHSTLYMDVNNHFCYIIDSWVSPTDCRPLSVRKFPIDEIIHALNALNSEDILPAQTNSIFRHYFLPPDSFATTQYGDGLLNVYTLNPSYIEKLYTTCIIDLKIHKKKTAFGGKPRNCKKTKKLCRRRLHKRSKTGKR